VNQARLGIGSVWHRRLRPLEHAFTYRTWFLLLPMRSLRAHPCEALPRNRFGLVSFHDADHGDGRADCLQWLEELLTSQGVEADGEVWLLCHARVLGHAFKPVSFWYCERADESLSAIVVEVHNTFGERHCYLLTGPELAFDREQRAQKTLHVSPFCRVEGGYRFRFSRLDGRRASVRIDHDDAGGALLQTQLDGALQPLERRSLRSAFWRMPMHALGVIARIHWQALRLWWRGVPWHVHPDSKPPAAARAAMQLLLRLPDGSLQVTTPSGSHQTFGNPDSTGPHAAMRLHNWKVCAAGFKRGDTGFAESYLDGDWDSTDLATLLRLFIVNREAVEALVYGRVWMRWLGGAAQALQRNTPRVSQRNVQAHYDLGNAFYRLWLDRTLSYSSALFAGDLSQTLEQAQHAKIERALVECAIGPGQRLLEIGCGWGALAESAAAARGAHVTAVTLSADQLSFTRERLATAGLAERAQVRLQDYRALDDGPYDAIVSIEMFEAVGRAHWAAYFAQLRRLLRRGGRALVQTITIRDDLFARYLRSPDFIRRHVFPGGLLPSRSAFRAQARAAGFEIVEEFAFGLDYAETLRRWRARFEEREAEVRGLGFDQRFVRLWRFYLAYCEAAFDTGSTDVVQFTLR
jgi:cyclopropane-fatty-acyl-phospholipid synthase